MTQTVEIPLDNTFDSSSTFYGAPWPEVIVRTLAVLQHYREILCRLGPKLIRAAAPPFRFLLNLSVHPASLESGDYEGGELAFHRDGRKVAMLNFLAGSHAAFMAFTESDGPTVETYLLEQARRLESEICQALKAEELRLRLRIH
jgi:hypothetical protein